MKKITIFAVLTLFCVIGANAQDKSNYVLSGTYEGLPDKTKVYLRTQDKDTVASTLSKGNKFEFKGRLNPDGRFLFIRFDTLVSKLSSKAIFVTNNPIVVNGNIGSREVVVKNSPDQDLYLSSTIKEGDLRNLELKTKLEHLKSSEQQEELNRLTEKYKELDKQWIEAHLNSKFTPWFLMASGVKALGLEFSKNIFNRFPRNVQESYYGVELKKQISTLESSDKIKEGSIMPSLTILDSENKAVSIHDVVQKNKLTLIDCWASWCSPCRAEVPKLKEVYEAYKGKGLNIVGISSDKSIVAWKKAIDEDQSAWQHFIEDKDRSVTNAFDLKAIPAYILVDNTGKMLAFDCAMSSIKSFGGSLRGEGLEKKLNELLGK